MTEHYIPDLEKMIDKEKKHLQSLKSRKAKSNLIEESKKRLSNYEKSVKDMNDYISSDKFQ